MAPKRNALHLVGLRAAISAPPKPRRTRLVTMACWLAMGIGLLACVAALQ